LFPSTRLANVTIWPAINRVAGPETIERQIPPFAGAILEANCK